MTHQNDNSSANKVWFITGASRGFGRIWAEAALKRGDKVAGTARTLASIAGLREKYGANIFTLELDVTNPDQVKTAVAQAHAHFGRLDIVLNNAGYSLVGTIEETFEHPQSFSKLFKTKTNHSPLEFRRSFN